MMELRQVIKEEVLEALHEQKQMLKEQRIILAPWRHRFSEEIWDRRARK